MAEVEIGSGKSARRAYGFDEIGIVPSRRTRDARDVDISWQIDAYRFAMPILGSALDSVSSPETAIEMSRLGGAGVLNLEGLWTRHVDPIPYFEQLRELSATQRATRMRALYEAPIQEQLIEARIAQIKEAGAIAAGALRPQLVEQYAKVIASAGLDLFVIKGTVVSAEHVSKTNESLNLKRFIREYEVPTIVGGCASYQTALHLMRSGAMGVLVGVGHGRSFAGSTVLGLGVPQATAIADARGARTRHLDETGVYCHVIADGGMKTGADIAKAIVCGADAVMIGEPLAAASQAPGRGLHWSHAVAHESLPRGRSFEVETLGSLQEVLYGPATASDGRMNLIGALRSSMALTGHETLKEFQKAELVINTQSTNTQQPTSALRTEQ